MLFIIALLTLVFTLLGGWLALRFSDRLHLVLGFSAGAVIAVAFFDLLPEAMALGAVWGSETIAMIVGMSFVAYLFLDRFVFFHPHTEEYCHNEKHQARSWLSAIPLSIHSFLDGLLVGLSFQVSTTIGLVVTLAVLAHKFSDGLSLVGLTLKNGTDRQKVWGWLWLDATAPVVGILVAGLFFLSETWLGAVLAIFCGFFLYLGASELLPESHHGHSTRWTTVATLVGFGLIFILIKIIGS